MTADPSAVAQEGESEQERQVSARPKLPPVLDLPRAAAMLGVGRTTAYKLVQQDRWPTPVLRIGRLIKVPTKPLLDLLSGGSGVTAKSS
jgi:predicted DNA-binding transcriptional regulator AlpA